MLQRLVTADATASLRVRIQNGRSVVAGALFVLTGAIAALIASDYSFGTAMRMGAGYFPMLVSVGLMLLGAIIALRGLALSKVEEAEPGDRIAVRASVFVAAGVLAFALSVQSLGLLLATLIMTLISGYARPAPRFVELASTGAALAGFAVLVFSYGLGLTLPVLPG